MFGGHMHWELSEEQSLYAESLREWLAARATPDNVRAWLDRGDARTFDGALIAEGWAARAADFSNKRWHPVSSGAPRCRRAPGWHAPLPIPLSWANPRCDKR